MLSRPQLASRSDIKTNACIVVNDGPSSTANNLFASSKKTSPAVSLSLASAHASGLSVCTQAKPSKALTRRDEQYLRLPEAKSRRKCFSERLAKIGYS